VLFRSGSQVDSIFYCTGVFNQYMHSSDVSELYPTNCSRELKLQGKDCLELMVDFGHTHNIEVFWSMRMNDTHDSFEPHIMANWKYDHPELLMGNRGERNNFPFGARRWSALNYDCAAVREQVFQILQDIAERYDVDGIELDFFRHPIYFKPQMFGEPVTQEHCNKMTDLLHRVREMTETVARRRGRPFLISTRMMDSPAYAKAIGLDVVHWLQEGLIDIIVAGGYFQLEPWATMVGLGQGYDVPVYACLSGSRLAAESEAQSDIRIWRGEALKAWKEGVDGIYLFNRFDPADPLFRELGCRETLERLESVDMYIMGREFWCNFLKDGASYRRIPENILDQTASITDLI